MKVLGSVLLYFKIQGVKYEQNTLVIDDLSRNMILGKDFLRKNKARIYFDLNKIRLNGVYFDLEVDTYLSAGVRALKSSKLEPQTAYLIKAKVNKNARFEEGEEVGFEPSSAGFIFENPELQLSHSVDSIKGGMVVVQIQNTANKPYNIRKGCLLGHVHTVKVKSCGAVACEKLTENDIRKQINTPEANRDQIEDFVLNNLDVMAFSDLELERTDLVTVHFETGNQPPINIRPYRIPLSQRDQVATTIEDLLQAGLIERSSSPWSFPLVMVEKKPDNPGEPKKTRMCVDFRKLNEHIVMPRHPLPLIEDAMAVLAGSTHYSCIDLRAGFHQLPLSKEASEKCAFSCFMGHFQYKVLPFGLNAAPCIFQDMVTKLLAGYEDFCFGYIDDVVVFTKGTLEEHLQRVQLVLNRLKKHSLKLKLSKCQWAAKSIKYLGFVVSERGIAPCADKIKAIRGLQPPKNAREVRGVLGMASFYRKFLPGFSAVVGPLINLTKKYARFQWTDECQRAFETLKQQLTVVPMLGHPDPNKPYILYTDCSDTSLGAVLVQQEEGETWLEGIPNEKPIYFLSHRLSPSQIKSYSTSERELFAIHYAISKLHFYLHNAQFVVKTDHKPLQYLLTAKHKNRRIEMWAMTIQNYNCKIEYLRGKDNLTADLLSRYVSPLDSSESEVEEEVDMRDGAIEVAVLNSNSFQPSDYVQVNPNLIDANENQLPVTSFEDFDIREEQSKDEALVSIKHCLQKGNNNPTVHRRFMLQEGILYYISQVDDDPVLRLYVPKHLKDRVINAYHHKNGHFGARKTFYTIKQKYYWPNLYKDLECAIDACTTCKERNLKQKNTPIQTTSSPPFPMAVVQLDLSGPFKKTLSGNEYIASFTCVYSGWIEAFSMPDKTAQSVLECLIEQFIPRHGCCLQLTTDNGAEFCNQYFKDTLEKLNIGHVRTSTYSPKGNSCVERSHRTLNDVLSKLINEHYETWDLHLNYALLAMRTHVSLTTLRTPFEIIYQREAILPVDSLLRPRRKTHSEDYHELALENLHKSFIEVLKATRKAKLKRNEKANKNRTLVPYEIGDHVFLKNHKKRHKLEKNWRTHFVIVEKTGPVSFRVRHQLTGEVLRVHADALRKASLEWHVPPQEGRPIRNKALAAVPPSDPDDSDESEGEDIDSRHDLPDESSDSDATVYYDPDEWVSRGVRRERKTREDPELDEDIPSFELNKYIRDKVGSNDESPLTDVGDGMPNEEKDVENMVID